MRIFVYEFIMGGGFQDKALPASLLAEGRLMLTSLLADLISAGYHDIVTMLDSRMDIPDLPVNFVPANSDHQRIRRKCLASADAVWIIAPETGNILYDLTMEARQFSCTLIGCSPESIKLCSSKKNTIDWLLGHGIECVPALEDTGTIPAGGCIVKPDDGVGGESCYLFHDPEQLENYLRGREQDGYLIQEFIQGIPASLSLLCHQGECVVLSCNRQLFEFEGGEGRFKGVIVNGLNNYRENMSTLARQIVSAIKGLEAYVGVDLILTDEGPRVLEINPRLTTSYAGIRQSVNLNPAAVILGCLYGGKLPEAAALSCQAIPVRL